VSENLLGAEQNHEEPELSTASQSSFHLNMKQSSKYEGRLKGSWTHVIRKIDRHRTSTKFRVGVITPCTLDSSFGYSVTLFQTQKLSTSE